jgi:hypothetical protein
LITPLSFCHHRKHPEIRSQNCVFQQPANVKIIPPLVYLAGIVIGFLATIWMPTKVVPNSVGRLEEFSFVAVLF